MIRCISPIDGSVYAEREAMSHDDALIAIARSQAAQTAWAMTPIETRVDLVMKGVANLGEMNDEIVPALAWQMGRPIRYGGEFGGVNERASYMANIAPEALSPIEIENSDAFQRMIKRVPQGVVLVIAPWNYPYMTAINTVAPALIAG
ncbi:MAG: aldehyde dehydrogenase family protein, partial [Pseudomonadota bacterium]